MRLIIALCCLVLLFSCEKKQSLEAILEEVSSHEFLTEEEREQYPLGRYTEDDFKSRAEFAEQTIEKLRQLDTSTMEFTDQISVELMIYRMQEDIDRYDFQAYLNPILVDAGFHIGFASRPNRYRFQTREDYEKYIGDLKAFPKYAEQHIELMRKGLAIGIAQPKAILEGYDVTYNTHLVADYTESAFYAPFLKIPASFSENDKTELLRRGKDAVENGALAGYQMVKSFFDEEYIPNAPDKIGASHWPNGKEYYLNRANYYTTTDLSVKEIHDTGLREVERIKEEMETVMKKASFKGTRKEFIQFLRTDPQFYPKTPQELLSYAAYLSKKADGRLPALFSKLPRQPYTVEPVAPHLAPKYTGGRYSGAPINSTRAGEYWVNTYDLPSRPLYVMPSLTLHEAVPGHHLQSALTKELEDLPQFRNNMYISAFGEGWGLYSEFLGIEMGMYETPYDDFGRLTYEMWRACRLVVDTGIHAYGWQRQQVIDYLAEHTALSIHECTTETDRYISWPGQALSYKIGDLKIKELRKRASERLGDNFDIREFHAALLSEGTLTLPLLEKVIEAYIKNKEN
ncbi:DUF885 family protein [Roseivirga sp. E12]|uniref:DUF885 domain-containing protein n=1 Tax=Roseivirga sp. E12 TaxID=2819237 RepID=UPI001ABC6E9D|nr:DUF885 domain-containing protein [Roseivirga sp. E12]MBO3699408.1 DUF885 domain-containing protein [Roseivirga sp. E12]